MLTWNAILYIFIDEYVSYWSPYYKTCAPCTLKYDFIAKLDPALEETKFTWDATGLTSTGIFMKNTELPEKYRIAKENKLRKLYRTVKRSTLIAVFAKYKMDYELFGFDFNYVLKLAGYAPLTEQEASIEPKFY